MFSEVEGMNPTFTWDMPPKQFLDFPKVLETFLTSEILALTNLTRQFNNASNLFCFSNQFPQMSRLENEENPCYFFCLI